MQLDVRDEDAYAIISPHGEIDLHHSPKLREQVLKDLNRGQSVLVDMSDVSYIDSSGIATLVEGLQHAKGRKLGFGLVGIGEGVMQVIKLTRLDQVFPIYESVASGKRGGG